MANDNITITKNEAAQRYEAPIDGALAVLEYQRKGDRIVLTHTEVPDELEGHGIGSALARRALDDARAQHLTVVPLCPFVSAYIRRHHAYLPLVDPAFRERLMQAGPGADPSRQP